MANGSSTRTRNTGNNMDRIVRGRTSVSQASQQPSSFRDVSNNKQSVLMMINGGNASGPSPTKH